MKTNLMIFIRPLHFSTIILMFIALFSCASTPKQTWKPLEGKVLNAKNGKPIDNAFVVAIWKGQMLDKGQTLRVCYHVENTITDEKGQFSINSWQERNNYQHITEKSTAVIVYKPGHWRKKIAETLPTKTPVKFYLEQNSNRNQQLQSKHRIRYLQKTVGSTACHLDDEDRKKLSSLYKSVLKEAKSVATSAEDNNVVRSIESWTSFASQ